MTLVLSCPVEGFHDPKAVLGIDPQQFPQDKAQGPALRSRAVLDGCPQGGVDIPQRVFDLSQCFRHSPCKRWGRTARRLRRRAVRVVALVRPCAQGLSRQKMSGGGVRP